MADGHRSSLTAPSRVVVLRGSTFVVGDGRGDLVPGGDVGPGLFFRDVRHLSRWQLRVDGRTLDVLGAEVTAPGEAVFFLAAPTGSVYRDAGLSVLRRRSITRDTMRERFEVTSSAPHPVEIQVSVVFDADFADLFEIKDGIADRTHGHTLRERRKGSLLLAYERGDYRRETVIHSDHGWFTQGSLEFRVTLDAGGSWSAGVTVTVSADGDEHEHEHQYRHSAAASRAGRSEGHLREWMASVPDLVTDREHLSMTYEQSLNDLAALRFAPDGQQEQEVPAAGLPWFMALFGRDSLIVSYQTLPYAPELCRTTLRALAARQATTRDDFRDAEPGKILHELRHGELTRFGERPQSPYYGSADATPLFLIVLDEYERWTGDVRTVCDLEPVARAALDWLDHGGDPDGDGFVEYATRNPASGLENQCWKDSWNSVVHPDGRLASLPRATCELQGYAYDARLRGARLARTCWGDPGLAEELERRAAELQARFDEAYWLADEGFYALALDGQEQAVPTLTSNIGHLLWSGIVPPHRVDALVEHLMGPALFTGWGVRTLARGQSAFNPLGYHTGTVWPHDTALVAAGLARYGRRAEAAALATGVLDAAPHFGHRLPEALVGMDRSVTSIPVAYPSACSPQAWATGAPLHLLTTLLGLRPDGERLAVDPWVPDSLGTVSLRGVPGRWGRCDVP